MSSINSGIFQDDFRRNRTEGLNRRSVLTQNDILLRRRNAGMITPEQAKKGILDNLNSLAVASSPLGLQQAQLAQQRANVGLTESQSDLNRAQGTAGILAGQGALESGVGQRLTGRAKVQTADNEAALIPQQQDLLTAQSGLTVAQSGLTAAQAGQTGAATSIANDPNIRGDIRANAAVGQQSRPVDPVEPLSLVDQAHITEANANAAKLRAEARKLNVALTPTEESILQGASLTMIDDNASPAEKQEAQRRIQELDEAIKRRANAGSASNEIDDALSGLEGG